MFFYMRINVQVKSFQQIMMSDSITGASQKSRVTKRPSPHEADLCNCLPRRLAALPSVGLILVRQAALVLAKAARVHLMLRGAVIQLLGDSLLDLHLGPLGLRDFGR